MASLCLAQRGRSLQHSIRCDELHAGSATDAPRDIDYEIMTMIPACFSAFTRFGWVLEGVYFGFMI